MNAKVLLFVFLVNCFLANSQTLRVKATIEIVDVSCTGDTTVRQVEFQKQEQNQYRLVKSFTTTQCDNEFILPKDSGTYKMVVNSFNCDEQDITFQMDAGKPEILLGKTTLFRHKKAITLSEVTVIGNKK